MGMFSSDSRRENELSLLANRVLNGGEFLKEEHYLVAIPALLLSYGANPAAFPWGRVAEAYRKFCAICPLTERRMAMLKTLAAFAVKTKGLPLYVWEPVFRCDIDSRLRFAAAHAAMTLSPSAEEPLSGVKNMLAYIVRESATDLLNGAFLTCDTRLHPLLEETWAALPQEARHWGEPSILSILSVELMVGIVEKSGNAEEREAALRNLVEMPNRAFKEKAPLCILHPFPPAHPDYSFPQVIDAVTALPAWKFPDTEPMPLHTWTCTEYLRRFLPRIEPLLNDAEVSVLARSWEQPHIPLSYVIETT